MRWNKRISLNDTFLNLKGEQEKKVFCRTDPLRVARFNPVSETIRKGKQGVRDPRSSFSSSPFVVFFLFCFLLFLLIMIISLLINHMSLTISHLLYSYCCYGVAGGILIHRAAAAEGSEWASSPHSESNLRSSLRFSVWPLSAFLD